MKLWRPSPLGPRKRAPAIETASTKNCGTRLLAALHSPPRATEAPVVAAASETPASGVVCGGAVSELRALTLHREPAARAASGPFAPRAPRAAGARPRGRAPPRAPSRAWRAAGPGLPRGRTCSAVRPRRRAPRRGQAPMTEPVADERLVDDADSTAVEDEAEPAVPVVGDRDRLVPAADPLEPVPADGGREEEAAVEDRLALSAGRKRLGPGVEAGHSAAVDLEQRVGREDVEVGPGRRERAHRLEPRRQIRVVRVEDDEEVAARPRRGRVQRGGAAAVLLVDEHDPVAVGSERTLEVVGRAVVADDHLVRRRRLAERRLHRLRDRGGRVVGRHEDGEPGRRAGLELPFRRRRQEPAHPPPAAFAPRCRTRVPAPTSLPPARARAPCVRPEARPREPTGARPAPARAAPRRAGASPGSSTRPARPGGRPARAARRSRPSRSRAAPRASRPAGSTTRAVASSARARARRGGRRAGARARTRPAPPRPPRSRAGTRARRRRRRRRSRAAS